MTKERDDRGEWRRSWVELFAYAITLTETTVDGVGEHLQIVRRLLERAQSDQEGPQEPSR